MLKRRPRVERGANRNRRGMLTAADKCVLSPMSPFSPYSATFTPEELAILQQAYEDACRKLGLAPSPSDPADNKRVRDDLVVAIVNAAKLGE